MYQANEEEKKVLEFWAKDQTFEKSVIQRPAEKPYVFYDGPPFATGLPHYGHILSSVIKDVVPRYWTMKGYRVRRRWGWDCHGLPIENLVEKELKISGKKEIDNWGIEKFNEACRSKVLLYTGEWKKMVERIGRWVEFDNAYKTMDSTYMESVWWALKKIWDDDRIYEGRKVLMYCPHCETPVSKAEIAMDNSYKDITEESATVKFKVLNPTKHGLPENTYILAWTTTPWTLPGNVALAVGKDVDYAVWEVLDHNTDQKENLVVAFDRSNQVFERNLVMDGVAAPLSFSSEKGPEKSFKIVGRFFGKELVGIQYEPLFSVPAMKETGKKAYYVSDADFVTTTDGTGVVHTAVIYGEDDYNLGLKLDLPMVPMLNEKGEFNDVVPEFLRGQYFKKAEKEIKRYLESRGLLFAKQQYTHSYPHCWRCETPLIYNAISAWFIDIQQVKNKMLKLNEKVNWYPEHLKEGRFKNILETAPDWNISRNRYWATPLPFWKCEKEECENVVCIGSFAELKKLASNFEHVFSSDNVEEVDLHKHVVDLVKLKCPKCAGSMRRIPEVIDCWVESGSMPFAEFHYPFENEKVFKDRFPGQYIAEYIAQTRAWFYYMHAMATLLFDEISFENCVTTGTILNDKGEKLSKSKQNYPDPWKVIDTYGVDALRFYMMGSVVMQADDLLFNEREVREIYNKVINMFVNVLDFYELYAKEGEKSSGKKFEPKHVLDRWILSKLQVLVKEVTESMDQYNTVKATRPIRDFVDELSTWYVRRSRDRFKGEDEADKADALATLKIVLETLAKVIAPFAPFIAEKVWRKVSGQKESVHLQLWPEIDKDFLDEKVLEKMAAARKAVELGLAVRADAGIKIRQPLAIFGTNTFVLAQHNEEYQEIVADELNVKQVAHFKFDELPSWLNIKKEINGLIAGFDAKLTPELKVEGIVRELVRAINQLRKESGFTIQDRASVEYATQDTDLLEAFKVGMEEIKRSTLTDELKSGSAESGKELELDGKKIKFEIKKS